MEPIVAKYLEGITDDMSAYDVALRLHLRLINTIDYDSVGLAEQEEDGLADGEMDNLRNICGAFLNGKSVCVGYARALQYLLQKCGIESAEVVGETYREDGTKSGRHAWTLIKVDGEYYHIDTTWDDRSDTEQAEKDTEYDFDYFCGERTF